MRRAVVGWAAALAISCGLLALPLVALAATSAVNIQNFAFAPSAVTITAGDSITWTNRDTAAHSAKFSDRMTPVLSQGQSATLVFTAAGTFPYVCGIHGSSMQGTITVRAPATQPPTTPPTPVRTAPPTIAATASPTVAPTDEPTAAPTTAAPTATPSPAATAGASSVAGSPSPVAVQSTSPPASGGGPNPSLIGVAALAVVALGVIAFFVARRS